MDFAYLNGLGLPVSSTVAALVGDVDNGSNGAIRSTLAADPISDTRATSSNALVAKAQAATCASHPQDSKAQEPKAMGCMQVLPTAALTKQDGKLTEHVFLSDTYLFDLPDCGLLEAVVAAETPKDAPAGHIKLSIVLDRTIFHPQGGGQPADIGELSATDLPTLKISMASARKEDGAVLHDCVVAQRDADTWVAAVGSSPPKVHCRIDEKVRRTNARCHSAGHLLDKAAKELDLKWIPGKGYHFPDGAYVEYVLNEDSRKIDMKKAGDKDEIIKQLQAAMERLVNTGGAVQIEYKADVRHVSMAGEECPCGGTHVKDVADLGKVDIKKLTSKSGNIRVSYTVASAA